MDGSRLPQTTESSPDVSLDMSPLLNAENTGPRRALQGAARYFRQAGARRSMREPSMLVRQSAAEQLEERQSDWAYSRPVVVLDLIWNLAFVIVATVILILSRHERPSTPLRIWIIGYALQCILHMICVCFEYHRRQLQRASARNLSSTSINAVDSAAESSTSLLQSENEIEGEGRSTGSNDEYDAGTENVSLAKRMESANTMFSFVWWIIGFYWITIGGQPLSHYAPHLYWLCIVFLAFDVFFVVFCVALACVIGIAVCCCLPCIIAILYAVADQEGASEEDINMIPKYKFRHSVCTNKRTDKLGGVMTLVGSSDTANERILTEEDAECCICLSPYDDGVELRELPCNHHFHCSCIDKWLRINATCPLCKFNIIHNNNDRHEEV